MFSEELRKKQNEEFGINIISKIVYTIEPGLWFGQPTKKTITLKPDGKIIIKKKTYYGIIKPDETDTTKEVYDSLNEEDFFELSIKVRDLLRNGKELWIVCDGPTGNVRIDFGFGNSLKVNMYYGTEDRSISDLLDVYLAKAGVPNYIDIEEFD